MTLPGQKVPVWKRHNSVKAVYSMKSVVRMLRNQSLSVLSNTRGGGSGVNIELRGAVTSSENTGDTHRWESLWKLVNTKNTCIPGRSWQKIAWNCGSTILGIWRKCRVCSSCSYSSLGILQKDNPELAQFLAWVGVVICVLLCYQLPTQSGCLVPS